MDIDVNTWRIAVTLAGFVLFLLLIKHSYSPKRKKEHQDAAMLPFLEEPRENTRE